MSVKYKDENGNISLIAGSDVTAQEFDAGAVPKTFIQSSIQTSVGAGATVTLYTCPSTLKRARLYINCSAQSGTSLNVNRIQVLVNDVYIAGLGQDSAYSSVAGSTFFYDVFPDDVVKVKATAVAMYVYTTIMEFN